MTEHGPSARPRKFSAVQWLWLIVWCQVGWTFDAARGADGKEAVKTDYFVTVEGKEYKVEKGRVTTLQVNGKAVKIQVREAEVKRFDNGDLSFSFPSGHTVGTEKQPEYFLWTLDGDSNVIMLYQLTGQPTTEFAKSLVEELVEKYGAENVKQDQGTIQLGKQSVPNVRLTVLLAGERVTQEVASIVGAKHQYVLMIQDSPQEDGTPSEESRQVKKWLAETFVKAEKR